MMDVKVNREIRDYTESVFFGLSLRQFIFSVISCVLAVGIYFLCFSKLGSEITGWLCIIPVKEIYRSGLFKVAEGKYSMTYKFEDINYKDASSADQEDMFRSYSQIIKSCVLRARSNTWQTQ